MSKLQMPRVPMDLSEAETLARAGASGRVADALLAEIDRLRAASAPQRPSKED